MATLYSSQAIADSSESTSGKIRVSTSSEALTGTNDTTAMTPAKVAAYVASATGTVTGNLRYKGAYDASANSPVLTSAKKGDFYVVSVAGTLAGVAINVGDHIVFNQDAASPITSAMFDTIDNTETPASTTTAGVIEIATNAEATAGSATDKALVPSNVASLSIANTQVTGLGTASTASTGTSAGNVIVLDGSARLPAVDASQLTNLPSASAASTSSAGIIEIATNAEATAGSATDKALVPSNVASLSIANTQVTGLGTASTASTGTSAGNVVVLDGSARLPAVDASQLTNLPSASAASTSAAGIIEIATNAEATAGSATDKALVPSNVASLSIANTQVTGLGTASTASTGTSAGNVVVLDGSARLPAVDASQLTNLPSASAASTSAAGIIEIATNTEAGAGSATDKALVPSNVGSLVLSPSQVTGLATVATSGAYSDVSGTPTLGTASSADTGTSAGNVIVLDGSAKLPAVDASQLTNITANQVGALSSSSAMSDLGDVSYTAGAGIDGYKLAYSHSNTRWEAVSDQGDVYTVQTSSITLSAGSRYIIPVSVSSTLTFEIPLQVDAGVIEVVNLSDQTIVIKGSTGRLFTADGQQAPSFGGYTRILYESKGTIKLVRDKGSSVNGEWYAHFHYPIETVSDGLLDGDALVYETISRSFKPSGVNAGEFVLSGNVGPAAISARHKYVTAYNETNPRTVEIGNPYYHADNCNALNNRRLYFENRGSSTLTIDIDQGPYVSGVYYRTYFYNFDGTGQSGSSKVLNAKESAVIEIVYDSTASAPTLKLFYQQNGHQLSIANTQVTGLGTSSTVDTGTSAGNVVVLDGSAKLPAVDGSALTNLPSGSAASTTSAGIIEIATNAEATAGSATDKALVPSNVASLSIANTQVTGLGTSSTVDTGTSAGNVVVLDGSAKLPAVDGSALTNLPSGSAASTTSAGIIEIATNAEATAGSATDKALVPSNVASLSIANTQVTGLGTSSTVDTGTSAGNVVVLDGSAKLPAVDGSALTNLPSASAASTSAAGIIEIATNAEATAGSATDKALVPSNVGSLVLSPSQVSGLATVATSGAYSDISGTPTLGTASSAASTDFLSGTGSDTLGGDLDVGTSDIISSSNNAIELAPHGTGVVTIKGNATGGSGQIKLNCEQNSHGIIIKGPPHSASATYTLTLPDDTGNSGEVLQTNGSGALSWVAQSGGGGGGGSAPSVTSIAPSSSYTISTSTGIEEVFLITPSADIDVVLIASATAGSGYKYHVKNLSSSYTITLKGTGSETIDGRAPADGVAIELQHETITIVSNGSNWFII